MNNPTALLRVLALSVVAATACGPERPDDPGDVDVDTPVPAPAPAPAPTGPVFHIDLPQGEGVPVLEANGQPLELHESPSVDAPVVATRDSIAAGTTLEVMEHRVVTVRQGRAVPTGEVALEVRSFGAVESLDRDTYYGGSAAARTLTLTPADTLLLLGDRAEGTCFVRHDGELFDATTCPTLQDAFTVLDPPTVEWWARVDAGGGATGWLLVHDDVVTVRRTF